jgi:UDP-N-acetylmuramyl pentapeptide phosphotransferase/UDP-N-acetylglucosamine-1-phosphate transferase
LKAVLLLIGAFIITYFVIPKIISLVEYKKLLDKPNQRSSHKKVTPTLGGISFFFTIMFSFFFLKDYDTENVVYNILPGFTILFIFGLKDDLVVLSPLTKLIGQLIAVAFILSNPSFQIVSLNGFVGIYEIPYFVSIGISSILMILVINAYNLIDGIDGLAAGIGVIIFLINTFIFYYLDINFYFYLSLIIIGVLVAFLRYNLSSSKKIFMGDTGSLIIGFLISVFTIKLLTINEQTILSKTPFLIENLPLVVLGILIIPLFDTLRVFSIRVFNKRSPFSADRNHIHHILIDLGLSHVKATILLTSFNMLFVILFIYISSSSKQLNLIIFLISLGLFFGVVFYRLDFSFANLRKKVLLRKKAKNIKKKLIKSYLFFTSFF